MDEKKASCTSRFYSVILEKLFARWVVLQIVRANWDSWNLSSNFYLRLINQQQKVVSVHSIWSILSHQGFQFTIQNTVSTLISTQPTDTQSHRLLHIECPQARPQ